MNRCRAQWLLWAVVVILGGSSLLSACGQTGDLYLPDPEHNPEARQQTR